MKTCALLLPLLVVSVPLHAQPQVETPVAGSTARKAILDALRAPIEKELGQAVQFKVDALRVQKGWAFVRGAPQRPDGRAVDYRGTKYREVMDLGAFDDGFSALLQQEKQTWRVVTYSIGATDVPWVTWAKDHRAPAAIFK